MKENKIEGDEGILTRSDLVRIWGSEKNFREAREAGKIPPANRPPRKGKKGTEACWDVREIFAIKAKEGLSDLELERVDDDVKLAKLILHRIYGRFYREDFKEGTDAYKIGMEIGSLFGGVISMAMRQCQREYKDMAYRRRLADAFNIFPPFTEEDLSHAKAQRTPRSQTRRHGDAETRRK